MATYIAIEPPGRRQGDVPDGTVLVRDGFSLLAFLVPLFWFLWHRMWIEALIALVAIFALAGLDDLAGFSGPVMIVSIASSFLVGLEAASLRLAALGRRGWRQWGVVEARDRGEAELRYVAEASAETAPSPVAPPAVPASRPSRVPALPARPAAPGLGLLDYPGRR